MTAVAQGPAAAQAQPFWAELPPADRGRYLIRAAQVMLDVSSELVRFLGEAHGRTPAEAWALELLPAVDALHWAARAGQDALAAERIPAFTALGRTRRGELRREPLGLVAVRGSERAPWAWPIEHVAAALMAGNGVLLAPSPAGERIARCFERAAVPEGIVSVAADLGPATRTFDDATAGLEAKGPMLVLADADLDRAAAAAAWGAFAAGGRLPAGVARVLVAREVAEAFAARAAIRAPDPAAVRGALAAADPLVAEADPGAVLPVVAVADDEEGLALAAAGPAGGGASVWSEDDEKAARMARAVPAPVVWVNDHASPIRPRPLSRFDEVTRPVLHARGGPTPWWPPQDAALVRALRATATMLYGRDADRAAALRDGLRPLLRLTARRGGRPSNR
jgi:acyl-CoA reductase-like NAD-dependent aldehyde dehydrogenase